MKINDIVTIKEFNYMYQDGPNKGLLHINAEARVVEVLKDGVKVCNGNMPFMGTLSWEFFTFDEIEKGE